MREAHAALRALAPRIADPELRGALLDACGLLSAGRPEKAGSRSRRVSWTSWRVSPRGRPTPVTAERLGLRPETVKGYLRSAMRRLGAHSRWEAVVAARRAGLLP